MFKTTDLEQQAICILTRHLTAFSWQAPEASSSDVLPLHGPLNKAEL
jgi:hypothetical protein